MWGRSVAAMNVLLLMIWQLGISHATQAEAGNELDLEMLEEILLKFKTDDRFSPIQDEVISDIQPQVHTTSGLISGSKNQFANSFFAIPFAVPPIRGLRFQAPEMLNTPDFTRNLGKAKNIACPQGANALGTSDQEYNENCLVLNVHVPATMDLEDSNSVPLARLPVLLFIHGGAFFIGAGTLPYYDGRYLSNATRSIVVTINYRLGPLGFLVFDDGKHKIQGNQGLKDQRLAMKWVNMNIGNFGGDPNKVTLFGESAGAQSTMFHLVSKQSEPFFQRAIMESNPAFYRYPDKQKALKRTRLLLTKLQCSGDSEEDCCKKTISDYQCLMSSSAKALIIGMKKVQKSLGKLRIFEVVEPFRPYIDKIEFADQPMTLFKKGKWNTHKPFIIGTNKEELVKWKDFLKRASSNSLQETIAYVARVMEKDEGIADRITNKYIISYDSVPPWLSKLLSIFEYRIGMFLTHFVFTCPSRALARFASQTTTSNVHLYVFDHALDCDIAFGNSSYFCGSSVHGEELFFVFRTIKRMGLEPNAKDILVSNQFSTYWGNMAWKGEPSGDRPIDFGLAGTFPKWPPYSKGQKPRRWPDLRIVAPNARVEYNHLDVFCFLIDLLQSFI